MIAIEPVKVPKWGLSMEEGEIVQWHVAEGDRVAEGDELVDIETTKITNVCEAHTDGLIRRLVAKPGQTLPVGALIAVMAEADVSDADIEAYVAEFESHFDPDETADTGLVLSTVDIAGGRSLRVGTAGLSSDAMPMVMLHGFGGDLQNWSLVQEIIAQSHPTYAIELPGHGQSTKDVGEGTLTSLAEGVAQAVDALDLDRIVLVGHSLGGAVALAVASIDSNRVAGLGLVCPAAMPGGEINQSYLDTFVEARRTRDLRAAVSLLFENPDLATRDMLDELIKMKRLDGAKEALVAIKNGLLSAADADATAMSEALATLSCPTALIASKADQIVGVPDESAFPPHTETLWVDNVGHMPHVEAPDAVAGALVALLRRMN